MKKSQFDELVEGQLSPVQIIDLFGVKYEIKKLNTDELKEDVAENEVYSSYDFNRVIVELLESEEFMDIDYSAKEILLPSGTKVHVKNRKIHRADGPAIEYPNGEREYYLDGESMSEYRWTRSWATGKMSVLNVDNPFKKSNLVTTPDLTFWNRVVNFFKL